MRNILLVTNIPNPYRVPLFNELARQLEQAGMHLVVAFGALGYRRRKFSLDVNEMQFTYRVLDSRKIRYRDVEKSSFTYDGLNRLIGELSPAAVVVNAFSIATIRTWFMSFYSRVPYCIWSGAIAHPADRVSLPRRLLRKILVRRSGSFIAYGSLARDYLISLGAPAGNIHIGINTVDTGFFARETARLRHSGSTGERGNRLLCVSYLTRRKRIDLLLEAVHRLSQRRRDFTLDVLGDGPEKDTLKAMRQRLGLDGLVSFSGFKQKHEIPQYFSEARVFLFPTEFDIWGLTLVEAMAAGLVCIASPNAGAVNDIIKQGVTGFCEDFEDPGEIAERIDWILDHRPEASRIGEAAAGFINEHVTLEKSAQGFVEAIRTVTS